MGHEPTLHRADLRADAQKQKHNQRPGIPISISTAASAFTMATVEPTDRPIPPS